MGAGVTVGRQLVLAGGVAGAVLLAGCQTLAESPGKVVGAGIGALIGAAVCEMAEGSDRECATAALAGAAVGLVLGDLYDRRRARLREIAEAQGANIQMEMVDVAPTVSTTTPAKPSADKTAADGFLAVINLDGMFPVGSAEPSPAARDVFVSIGAMYAQDVGNDAARRILVVGHTDATGAAELNQRLSERRARRIAELIHGQGVPADRLYLQGVGSSQPIDTNQTPEGRSRNRRVEILDVESEAGLISFADQRRWDARFLAHAATSEAAAPIPPSQASTPSRPPAKPSRAGDASPGAVATPPSKARPADIDFGGHPVVGLDTEVVAVLGQAVGKSRLLETINPLGAAQASAPAVPCHADAPRLGGEVMHLGSGRSVESKYRTTDFLPGLNERAWASIVNGHLVALGPVGVLRKDMTLSEQPTLSIYPNYPQDARPARKPATWTELYAGTEGTLLRVFTTDKDAFVQCLDVALPRGGGNRAIEGRLYYRDSGVLRAAAYRPALAGAGG